MNDKLVQLTQASAMEIMALMSEWGYSRASAPDARHKDGLWWAGFTKAGQSIYSYGDTPETAIKQAAIETIKELENGLH